ncbi:hypothetical protein BJ165DRAFT_1372253 [Panaeolus papilionaceus]|nr:hypothetical protein BJ165DRAFT_1372253 [Panaeolus papilionaceus]
MSGIASWIWGTSQLDDAVDKATSELLPAGSEDIALNLEICDQIRSKSVPVKDAMKALKRRLNHKNPNVQLLALGLTDICVKNGGDAFLVEIASREFLDNLVSILKMPALNHDVKTTILRLIQNWSIAFEGKPTLSYTGQVYKTLLNEGYKFPPKDLAVANSAMVDTQTAPEWIDSDVCLRCRTAFSFTNRKHHCRNCGQVFDQACSSKTMALPHYGITQEVRVCDGCHNKLLKKAERADKPDKPHKRSSSTSHRHRSARELADEELQRAIQLSLEEANGRSGYVSSQPAKQWGYSEPPLVDRSTYPDRKKISTIDEEEDPDLKAAIEASLREANAPKPSAPVVETPRSEESPYPYGYAQAPPRTSSIPALPKIPTYDLDPMEADAILTFNQTVEQVQAQGGRDLSRYPAVTELYDKANGLRPKLAMSLDDAGRKEQMLTEMHDQLSQAVKLYDQILSQQVAQPRWRSSAAAAPSTPSYQQQYAPPQTAAPATGYQQWTPPVQTPAPYSAPVEAHREPASPHMAYSSPPPDVQYGLASRPQTQAPQWQSQPSQPVYQPPATQHLATPPVSMQPSIHIQPQYQQFAAYNPAASAPALVSPPISAPPSIPQSPQASHVIPPATPSLTRHNTVAYAAPPAHNLARSNTVASSSMQRQPQAPQFQAPPPPPAQYQPQPATSQPQYQQQQPSYTTVSAPPAPTSLPQFPSVPTEVPQPAYSLYGFEHKEERKEAMLIDL